MYISMHSLCHGTHRLHQVYLVCTDHLSDVSTTEDHLWQIQLIEHDLEMHTSVYNIYNHSPYQSTKQAIKSKELFVHPKTGLH